MSVYTTEIASDNIPSDNPIHQRLLQAYYLAKEYINGDMLEIGCGEGRGVDVLAPLASDYQAIDKIGAVVDKLQKQYSSYMFKKGNIPPLPYESESFDTVVSFQVIEHIKNDQRYLEEIHRVLKPGGVALITTPNIKKTLTRNPWHIREYTAAELKALAKGVFNAVKMLGIGGNEKVMEYYEQNKQSVAKVTRFDIFNLQYRLPASFLKIPYDILNRRNRNTLSNGASDLVKSIKHTDYLLSEKADASLDLFCVMTK